jgi:hypothetical protein
LSFSLQLEQLPETQRRPGLILVLHCKEGQEGRKGLGDTWRFQQEKASLLFPLPGKIKTFVVLYHITCCNSSSHSLEKNCSFSFFFFFFFFLFFSSTTSSSQILYKSKQTRQNPKKPKTKKQNKTQKKKNTKAHIDTQQLTTKGG